MSLSPFSGRQVSRSSHPSWFDDVASFAPLLRAATSSTFADGNSLRPALDVREDKDGYHVQAELPGIQKENIKLQFSENARVLTLSGSYSEEHKEENKTNGDGKDKDGPTYWLSEISRGNFIRSIRFPVAVDEHKVKAALKDGLLSVTIPKATPKQGASIKID